MKRIPIINQIIKDKRKELKITQEEFKNIINKGIATIKRYDTGDIIPENTLILICDKLTLSIAKLCLMQDEENKRDNTSFYQNIINKYIGTEFYYSDEELKFFVKYTNNIQIDKVKKLKDLGNKLEKMYTSFYNLQFLMDNEIFLDTTKKNFKEIVFQCEQDNNNLKNIIKLVILFKDGKTKEKILDIFSIEECQEIFFFIEECFNARVLYKRKFKESIQYRNNFRNALIDKNNLPKEE